jgi:hypothetical protein
MKIVVVLAKPLLGERASPEVKERQEEGPVKA